MDKIEANKLAWGKISEAHFEHFKARLADEAFKLNPIVEAELGDIAGKRILHLQCNTGADTILLARKGAIVTGVDLVPGNIHYARELARHFEVENVSFVESDVLKLSEVHEGEYDIVMTTDGVIGWLPDLETWGRTISHFLKADGFFYLHDAHPFMLIFDERAMAEGRLIPRYPYFKLTADPETHIGGYASEVVEAENYYWGHQLSTIVGGLLAGSLHITYLKEYDRCAEGMGGSHRLEDGLYIYPELEGKLPLTLSLKAKRF